MKSIRFIILILSVFLLAQNTFAGGWTQKQGAGFYKLGFDFLKADRYYSPTGKKINITTTGEYTFSLYSEYGITDRLTATAYIPFFKRLTVNRLVGRTSGFEFFEGDARNGFADIDLGIRYRLLQFGPTVVSSSLTLGIPVGSDKQENGLFTGDGEFNQLVAFEAGHSFYPKPWFATATLGFNNRTNGFSDEFRYGFQLGYQPWKPFLVALNLRGVKSLENGKDGVGGTSGFAGNDVEYLSYGLEVMHTVTGSFGLTAGFVSATLGQNALAAPVFSVGVFYR